MAVRLGLFISVGCCKYNTISVVGISDTVELKTSIDQDSIWLDYKVITTMVCGALM